MDALTGAERLAARSRAVTVGALAVLTLLAWSWLLAGAGMSGMMMNGGAARFFLIFVMWGTMMTAMMLPSAAPVILLYGRAFRHATPLETGPPTASFVAGYLACWTAFALVAAALQLGLDQRLLAKSASLGPWLSGGFLIAAGLYQWSPLKDACLGNCRTPAAFLARHYRPGRAGAWRLGMIHGAYCVGCCWALMVLLFVGGVMNLAWIAALTLLVAAEKLLPAGRWIARIAGALMIGWGVVRIAA